MLPWLQSNAGTIAVGAAVAALFITLAVKLIKDKKQGKNSCCGGCSHCAMQGQCHKGEDM